MVYCSACGAQISPQAVACPQCGHPNAVNSAARGATGEIKSRVVAALLAIFLGHFGAHKFYLGQSGTGILYACFFWTGIPGIFGLIEGLIYLSQTDAVFSAKQRVRTF